MAVSYQVMCCTVDELNLRYNNLNLLKELNMIRPINTAQQTLRIKATAATKADKNVVIDLLDTLKFHQDHCVGMAANMIGVNKSIIVCQLGAFPVAMINPKIISKRQPYQTTEGCLSLPGERSTTRYQSIAVEYIDQNFEPQKREFSDFFAQIIQHEVDHCNGILI